MYVAHTAASIEDGVMVARMPEMQDGRLLRRKCNSDVVCVWYHCQAQ